MLALSLPKTIEAVEAARQETMGFLTAFAVSEEAVNRIEVILEELVSNVVRHSAQARSIELEVAYRDGAVQISVEDDGAPFNPLEQAAPARFSTLEEAPLGGLGIPLIKRLSQSVNYERIAAGNRICVVVAAQ